MRANSQDIPLVVFDRTRYAYEAKHEEEKHDFVHLIVTRLNTANA